MSSLCFLQEDTSGRYVQIVFDYQKEEIKTNSKKIFYCQEFLPYGLQANIKIEEADKESSLKELENILSKKAKDKDIKYILISIDKSKFRMSWIIEARYQFLVRKNQF